MNFFLCILLYFSKVQKVLQHQRCLILILKIVYVFFKVKLLKNSERCSKSLQKLQVYNFWHSLLSSEKKIIPLTYLTQIFISTLLGIFQSTIPCLPPLTHWVKNLQKFPVWSNLSLKVVTTLSLFTCSGNNSWLNKHLCMK